MTDRFMLSRRQLLKTSAAGAALGIASSVLPFRARLRRRRHGRLHLCRPEGRLRLQPGACRGRGGAEGHGRPHRRRGGERPGDRRRPEDHGIDDQPRRRLARLPDLVRLFRPAHAGDGARSIPDVQFRHCGGLWTKDKHPTNTGSYFGYIGMGQYLNGIVAGHTTQVEEDRLRRGQADPAGAAQHQLLHARRAQRRSDDHLPGDLHRRMVAGGEGSGGDQRADRPGHRRRHLPCRQPEGGGRDGGRPRRLHLRLPRQPEPARAGEIPDRRRMELGRGLQDVRRRS